MSGFIEQHYWAVYAADFIFRSACYVTFAILLIRIAGRLKPRNPNPRPNCGCGQQRQQVAPLLHDRTDSDPPKASE